MTNNIINTAITQVNEARTLEAVRNAQGIIGNIERELDNLALLQANVKELQDSLNRIKASELTFEMVTGYTAAAGTTSVTGEIIRKSVEAIVESRRSEVETKSVRIASEIANKLDAVKATSLRINALRNDLEAVAAKTVNASQIVSA